MDFDSRRGRDKQGKRGKRQEVRTPYIPCFSLFKSSCTARKVICFFRIVQNSANSCRPHTFPPCNPHKSFAPFPPFWSDKGLFRCAIAEKSNVLRCRNTADVVAHCKRLPNLALAIENVPNIKNK